MSRFTHFAFCAALSLMAAPAVAKDVAVNYTCQGGKTLAVTYHFREATMAASTMLDGKVIELAYDMQSDRMSPTFKKGPYTLALGAFDVSTVRKVGGLNITKDGKDVVNGKSVAVSEMLYKGCNPK